jgi:hypothetical protein
MGRSGSTVEVPNQGRLALLRPPTFPLGCDGVLQSHQLRVAEGVQVRCQLLGELLGWGQWGSSGVTATCDEI